MRKLFQHDLLKVKMSMSMMHVNKMDKIGFVFAAAGQLQNI